jgi:uncharacterized Zn finger protein (UPF0148 family)
MSFDDTEEGEPCDFCGLPVSFSEDDWTICPTCKAEYSNMDYTCEEVNDDEEY